MPSLKYRRERADMLEVYKHVNGHYSVQSPFQLENQSLEARPRPATRNMDHSLVLERVPQSHWGTVRAGFFSVRAVNNWNKLDGQVVGAPTLNSFKNRLDTTWKKKMFRTPYGAFTSFIIDE